VNVIKGSSSRSLRGVSESHCWEDEEEDEDEDEDENEDGEEDEDEEDCSAQSETPRL